MPRSIALALSDLLAHRIDFVVVGGVAAVLQGAPIHTFDLDIVYAAETGNIDRLLGFLQEVEAVFRVQPERRIQPNKSHLEARGHLNLLTRYGPLDVLGTIGCNLGYEELIPHSQYLEIAEELRVRVLDLETIIDVKEQLGTDKDQASLPVLRETARLKKRV